MRKNRILPILGLALALPLLIASMAFACESSCGSKASAASASTASVTDAATADAKTASGKSCSASQKAACAAANKGATAVAAGAGSSCSASKAATAATAASADAKDACGVDCAKACCAGAKAAMITYNVSGMTCMGCVKQVEAAVAKMEIENLESVTVNLDGKNAVLTTTGPVDAKAVAAAITKAGFPAEFATAAASETEEEAKEEKEADESAATM